jgi:16S rRNA (guanine527-N7)-methyltransferase
MVDNVILDSLAFLQALPASVSWIADVGSGAGLPGIPIAIVRPNISMSLIEARQRRVSFLSTVVRELGLSHVEVVASRAEALGEGYISRYDAVVMRCAGGIGTMLKVALGLLRTGGVVVVSSAPASPRPPTAERLTVTSSTGWSRTLDRFVKL